MDTGKWTPLVAMLIALTFFPVSEAASVSQAQRAEQLGAVSPFSSLSTKAIGIFAHAYDKWTQGPGRGRASPKRKRRRSAPRRKRSKTCTVRQDPLPADGQGEAGPGTGGLLRSNKTLSSGWIDDAANASCFPALDFRMPSDVPGSLDGWWCSQLDEYAFLGFSYDTSSCPSSDEIRSDFARMRNDFHSRYVRIYQVCDRAGFQDDLIDAAWANGLGLHMLLWFGFDGTDEWKGRKQTLLQALKSNLRAPYVVRAVAIGSEPLYDYALEPDKLAKQIESFRSELAPWTERGDTGMLVTLSEMAYGFKLQKDAPQVFAAVDVSEANVLPFLDPKGTTGDKAFPLVERDYQYFSERNGGKKVYMTQTGWPSNDSVWKANSKDAVASVKQEKAYFDMLDEKCEWMKSLNYGGVGWFAHIWRDYTLPGWGIIGDDDKARLLNLLQHADGCSAQV
ncbi:hypothetical protein ACQY0O_008087 [Thecaphora frezii]